jgi:hypothetical protein
MATTVILKDLYKIISKQFAHKTIYIEFIKKSDGSLRKMTFQLTGSKADNGNRLPIHRVLEDVENQILTVWDLNNEEYRRLNLANVQRLVIDQEEFIVIP